MRVWRVVLQVLFGQLLVGPVLIGATGIGWAAAPAQAEEGVRLTGTAGWAGRCRGGQPILVRARIAADRLVSGILSAESLGPIEATSEVPVEVAGGAEKEVLLVVAASFGCTGVTLRLEEARGTTTTRIGTPDAADTVLLGLLPGARAGALPPASAVARTGVAAVAGVEPEVLNHAGAIGGLDSLGASPADLDGMSPEQHRALLTWVAAGGTLLVDTEGPDALGALPEPWRPAGRGRASAGHGQVRLTGTALRDGRLDGLAEPGAGPSSLGGGPRFAFDGTFVSAQSVLQERSGLRVLSLPLILGALVLYVLLAGPGIRIGLARAGRLHLTWLAVPLAAVTFTGLAVAGGDLLRRGGRTTHVSVVETEAAGARARSWVGVPTRSKGQVVATLPPGWLVDSGAAEQGVGRTRIRATPNGERLQTPGRAGGFVILGVQGPSAVEGRLTVRLDPDGRRGTVQNDLRVPLEGVAVFAAGSVTTLGRLEPGASTPFTTPAELNGMDTGSLARVAWGAQSGGLADPRAFSLLADIPNPMGPASDIVAAGWSDQLASPVALRGSRPGGTTLVLGRPDDGPPSGQAVGTSTTGLATTRFVVPAGAAYRLSLSVGMAGGMAGPDPIWQKRGAIAFMPVEVLVGDTWTPASDGASLPAGASSDGVVYIRMSMGGFSPALVPA